ncbi:L,D-transpeptidase family protein [Candidatus Magnetominusculus xianensis]|uniref:ErfK/YbiS/YcfS/YnhG family protein n=1 Tax=Candidatus Magnetominusculus xianensis TaxID=1748249 RepID=A0ABR5SHK4_9BACT|nr:L,D-transpeptidase [Candidatus Magnetominusculus xianensis]KWT83442.1 ErfK/YbiS/YcfS/YnhG family protein [Candidatus Magnetominusculus xianensis]MBF0405086.1 L,D-transpeptidase family protein [Nitrospirota bacterium]
MKKLLLIFLSAAAVCLTSAFAETLMVAVDNVTVHDEPGLASDVRFQLYRGMEVTPEERSQRDGVAWVRFDIRGRQFWAVESDSTAPLFTGKFIVDSCSNSDKKILVTKKLRSLTVFVKNDNNTWAVDKTYPIGLGKGTGTRAFTREITRPFAYLILMGNKTYDLFESTGDALNNALYGEAVIALNKAAKSLTLYPLKHGRLDEETELQVFAYGEKILYGDYVVEFSADSFDIIINNELYPKMKKFDRNTPEGTYYVARINPASRFGLDPETHRSLASLYLSYPNAFDAWDALRFGIISIDDYTRITAAISQMQLPPQDTAMGNLIMIHGGGDDDWTAGCIALDDEDMKELLDKVGLHTCVEIK